VAEDDEAHWQVEKAVSKAPEKGRGGFERSAKALLRLQPLCVAPVFQGMDAGGKDGAIRHLMSVLPDKKYIAKLKNAIRATLGCGAHFTTVPVMELFCGKSAWQGDVEIFNLFKHPKAALLRLAVR